MLNNTIENKKICITVKGMIALFLIGLSITLPLLVHLVFGAKGGVYILPMYLPVIIGGFILGKWYGLAIGISSPLLSFAITGMPNASRLPFMVLELSVFAFIAGMFSNKISVKNVFLGVILAQLIGRLTFILSIAIMQNESLPLVINQVKLGLVGIGIQLVITPIVILLLDKALKKNE